MFSGITLTAIWGLLSGIVTGLVPDLLEEFKRSRDESRKDADARRQKELAEISTRAETDRARIDATARETAARYAAIETEIKAVHATVEKAMEIAARPTGFGWIDAFNALLRPSLGTVIMSLFAIIVLHSVVTGSDSVIERATLGPLLADLFIGYFFHLFGYRGARKEPITPLGLLGIGGAKK